jgi:uncharacterized protein
MTSLALYEGWVAHRRVEPVSHSFRYRIFLPLFDLEELPQALDPIPLWSARRPAPAWFRRDDYLGGSLPLAEAAREQAYHCTGRRPAGPVRLLANPRYLGVGFNPVSFYFLHDSGGELDSVIAEVTNTPWGERHAYVLEAGSRTVNEGDFDKALHVSPFMPMDQRYTWRAPAPGTTLSVQIESTEHGERAFDATLNLTRRPLTARGLANPTIRLIALIYGHAVALKLKGVPVQPHPAR